MAKLTAADVEKRIRDYEAKAAKISRRIICCGGTGCVANGSLRVRDALVEELKKAGQAVEVDLEHDSADHVHPGSTYVSKSGCQGFCQMGPLVRIEPDGIIYTKVRPEDALEIVQETVIKHNVIERLLYMNPSDGKRYKGEHEIPFYNRQHRLVLANCTIEPDSIGEYFHKKGYLAALKAYTQMTPEEVCSVMEESGLRGRGGGGFPTGRKWKFTLASPGPKKYVICNGDEGDPGAFMDRSVMEGNPHSVIEGMMIAARAIGADEGYVYVRAEYPLAVVRMRKAVKDAEEAGVLGDDIFGSGLSFRINVMEGAGAFVCGEETALMASIEGKRGMPMPKPPFPAQRGLWGKPTVINNVETLGTVPYVIREGAAKFRELGVPTSPGTKTFALTGHVANTGLIEVPFGTTLGEIVNEIGGGVTDSNGKVSIEYPILSNLRDSSKTDAVNELIKTQATRIINDYELDPETDTVAVTCNILSLDRSRAVFTYEGSMMTEGAAHPQALFYTTTVDLDLGTLVGFSDYADAQTMAEYILSDECRLYYPSASDEVLAELKAMDKTALTDILKSCDFTSVSEGTFPQSFSYENQGDIYMVLPVSHALGDYAIVRYTPDTK